MLDSLRRRYESNFFLTRSRRDVGYGFVTGTSIAVVLYIIGFVLLGRFFYLIGLPDVSTLTAIKTCIFLVKAYMAVAQQTYICTK